MDLRGEPGFRDRENSEAYSVRSLLCICEEPMIIGEQRLSCCRPPPHCRQVKCIWVTRGADGIGMPLANPFPPHSPSPYKPRLPPPSPCPPLTSTCCCGSSSSAPRPPSRRRRPPLRPWPPWRGIARACGRVTVIGRDPRPGWCRCPGPPGTSAEGRERGGGRVSR